MMRGCHNIMRAVLLFAIGLVFVGRVFADKYGIDESMSESEGSWGVVGACILLFLYLYFKGK